MHISKQGIIIGLTLVGSIGSLLTFARLWQLKEWRLDRLREHLRAEGFFRQLFGIMRPAVILLFILIALSGTPIDIITTILLGALAAIASVQLALRMQPRPIWTAKAKILVFGTILLTTAISTFTLYRSAPALLPAIVLLQPAIFVFVWAVFLPIDKGSKCLIFREAMRLRSVLKEPTVIGITGSAGKTTTKELLAHILEEKKPLTAPAHVNTEVGVAQWLIQKLGKEQQTPQILIIEMGAYHTGEIALLCNVVQPTIGIVTYIGSQHIGLFGSKEELCKAKGELIEALPETGHAFLNVDNEHCDELAQRAICPVSTVGTGGYADIEAFDVEETTNGIRLRVQETMYEIPIHGTHNVTNVLLAIATAKSLGMSHASIASRLKTFSPPAHTFEVRDKQGITILDDTHNASPGSFQAAIQWARSQPAEQKVLLTSGLIELGEEQDRTHAELGSMAAPVFDRVVFLSRQSAKPFRNGFGKEVEIYNKNTQPITESSLLVCVGRMSEHIIQNLLPSS